MEGARPVRAEDLAQCRRLLQSALDAAVHLRGGPQALASLARAHPARAGEPGAHAEGGATGATTAKHSIPDAAALLESWTDDTAHHVLVGTVEDEVVGIGAGHCEHRPGGTLGIVDWVYVEPEARGVGVGAAMADALLAWFAAQGCTGVDALALPGDRESKQLFESLGLSARLLILHRRLP